jgi:hypothetical protein
VLTILRPLSTSELLDRTFHLYRNNFVVFFAIAAIPQLPVLGLNLLIARVVMASRAEGLGLWSLPLSLGPIICVELSQAATVVAVSNLHLGRPVRIADAFSAIRGILGRVIWISFAISWIIGFGLMLLVVPGILWTLKYALAIPVTVLEGTDLHGTKIRSDNLTEGRRGRIFVVYGLLLILTSVVSACFNFALGLGSPLHPDVTFTSLKYALTAASSFLSGSLVTPLLTIALTLLYYDERVRKEGFDLELMMSNLKAGVADAVAVPAS